MSTNGSNTKNFLTGLLVGAIVGVVAGILLAPDRGSETRRKIIDSAEEFTDDLSERLEALKAKIERKMNDIKSTLG